ncbi:MAG: low-complexity protein [Gammaproteobacteria bacterium]|jgi:uncharacterized low-complexity protein
MSKKTTMKPVATAIGAALAGSLTLGAANAAENPFGLSELGSGYMQLAGAHEGKCGEGKCGEAETKAAESEGKCGEGKCGEGKCGEGMASDSDEKAASSEGKCGESK